MKYEKSSFLVILTISSIDLSTLLMFMSLENATVRTYLSFSNSEDSERDTP